MDSLIHIITDLPCRVLHFGVEVCSAMPGEDIVITLRKGRHKLTFVSADNAIDYYSCLFEVKDNDMEDFVEVELCQIRDRRLKAEAETGQHEEVIKRIELERQKKSKKIEEENRNQQRVKEERLRENEQRSHLLKTIQEITEELINKPAIERQKRYENLDKDYSRFAIDSAKRILLEYQGSDLERKDFETFKWKDPFYKLSEIYPFLGPTFLAPQYYKNQFPFRYYKGIRPAKGANGKYGYVNYDGDVVIDFIYEEAWPFAYDRAVVVYDLLTHPVINTLFNNVDADVRQEIRSQKYTAIINTKGDILYYLKSMETLPMFQQGLLVDYQLEGMRNFIPYLRVFDLYGNLILEKRGWDELKGLDIRGGGHFRTIFISNNIIHFGACSHKIMTLRGDIIDIQGFTQEPDPRLDVFAPGFPISLGGSVKWLDEFGQPSDYPGLPSSHEDLVNMWKTNRAIRHRRLLEK